MAEKWLEREVAQGLMGLVALRLEGAPAADAINQMLDIWLEAIRARRWDEQRDAERIRAGFRVLFGTCERWPAPARLLSNLPPPKSTAGLPAPVLTDEQRNNGRRQLAEILQKLKPRLTPTQSKEHHP